MYAFQASACARVASASCVALSRCAAAIVASAFLSDVKSSEELAALAASDKPLRILRSSSIRSRASNKPGGLGMARITSAGDGIVELERSLSAACVCHAP